MSAVTKNSLLAVVAAAFAFSTGDAVKAAAVCGWIGVGVRPVSAVMAESLGVDEPYGGISDPPEPDSPAAIAQIEAGDWITAINDTPLVNAQDFAPAIAAMAPGTTIYLSVRRNGQVLSDIRLIVGSGKCPAGQ
jgi:S1-C subfamily serine protease